MRRSAWWLGTAGMAGPLTIVWAFGRNPVLDAIATVLIGTAWLLAYAPDSGAPWRRRE